MSILNRVLSIVHVHVVRSTYLKGTSLGGFVPTTSTTTSLGAKVTGSLKSATVVCDSNKQARMIVSMVPQGSAIHTLAAQHNTHGREVTLTGDIDIGLDGIFAPIGSVDFSDHRTALPPALASA